MNGVKTRVEKLCQAFENGMELVELSQAFPHDISNVLKLYLRQVCVRRSFWYLLLKSSTFEEHRFNTPYAPPAITVTAPGTYHAIPTLQPPDGFGQGEPAGRTS